jgi:hypothetical protein
MADKLSESTWTGFLKKQKLELDDGALRKSLAKFDKTDESKPEPRLDALNDLVEQFKKQIVAQAKRKKELGDKPFALVKDQLYELLGEAEALQKKTQAAMAAEDDEDEESAPNALLDSKVLFKQLTLCRRDPERTMKFAFVDAKDKAAAVLVLHPRMGARSLFSKLQAAAGVKTGAYGSAWVDGTSLMLQLDKPLSGLVKKVRAPVKAAGFKIAKAVLWNEDGTVFEQDEGDDEKVGIEAPAAGTGAASDGLAKPAATGSGASPARQPASAEQLAYTQRLRKVRERYEQALREQHPESTKLRALMGYASEKADEQHDYAAAAKGLEALEKLLAASTAGGGSQTREGPGGVDAGAAFKARMTALIPRMNAAQAAGEPAAQDVKLKANEAAALAGRRNFDAASAALDQAEALLARTPSATATARAAKPSAAGSRFVEFAQTRLAWDQTRKTVQAELKKLENQILAQCKDEPDLDVIAAGTRELYVMLEVLDERLIDVLDDALNAQTAEKRKAFHGQAREVVDEYLDFVNTEPLLKDIDRSNGFIDVTIRSTLTNNLNQMASQLNAAFSRY